MGMRKHAFSPLLGKGIFAADGENWKAARDLYRPLFNKSAEQTRFTIIQDHAERLVQSVLAQSTRETVDLQPLFYRFSLNTTTQMIFGTDKRYADSKVQGHDASTAAFGISFRDAQEFLVRRYEMMMGYALVNSFKFRKDVRLVKRWVKRKLDEYTGGTAEDQQKDGSSQTLVDVMSLSAMDKTIKQDHIINLLLAGRDTTACTLSWTL